MTNYLGHIEVIRQSGSKEDILSIDDGTFADEIRRISEWGYALRKPNFWQAPFDPGPEFAAMAFPILSATGVHGSVSSLWVAAEMTLEQVLALGALHDLRITSAKIGAALDKQMSSHQNSSPPYRRVWSRSRTA